MQKRKFKKNNKGQIIMEFLLLLAVFLAMGFLFLGVTNGRVGKLWVQYVGMITSSDAQSPQMPELN